MYIVIFDSCDPYVCTRGAYIFKNKKDMKEFYKDTGFEQTDRVFEVKRELFKNEICLYGKIFDSYF